jgi:hypothetical protein
MILTEQFLGLPQPVIDLLKDRVVTAHTIRTPQIYDAWVRTGGIPAMRKETKVRQSTRTITLNAYALNLLHSRVHEMDFVYMGEESGAHVFRKEAVHFTLHGTEHRIPAQVMYVNPNGTIDTLTEAIEYSYVTNRQRVYYTAEETAALAGVSVSTLYDWDRDTMTTQVRNTVTHICNAFVELNLTGSALQAQLYINGIARDVSEYGNFTTMQGTRTSLRVNIVTYNDCTPETADASAGYEAGNFGACSILKDTDPNLQFIPDADLTREHAVVEYRFCEQPETGKEWRWHGYYDLKTQQQIPSLIRKPHPDAIFH